MANLTITVDEDILKRARMRALEEGTSVNALLAEYLTRFAEPVRSPMDSLQEIWAIVDKEWQERKARGAAPPVIREPGRTLRDEIYDERMEELERRRNRSAGSGPVKGR